MYKKQNWLLEEKIGRLEEKIGTLERELEVEKRKNTIYTPRI